jgi:hypothetical protein
LDPSILQCLQHAIAHTRYECWTSERPDTITPKPNVHVSHILHALGNSIVPRQVATAITVLLSADPSSPNHKSTWAVFIHRNEGTKTVHRIHTCPPTSPIKLVMGGITKEIVRWPTPTATHTHVTRLTLNYGPTTAQAAFFCNDGNNLTQRQDNLHLLNKHWVLNPTFVRWLMGYPISYVPCGVGATPT